MRKLKTFATNFLSLTCLNEAEGRIVKAKHTLVCGGLH